MAWKLVKGNIDVFNPVATPVLDMAVPAAIVIFGQPIAGAIVRGAVKQLTGAGINMKKWARVHLK